MLYSLRQHLWPVLCQKLWHYSNMCISNNYFVNKLSTFLFQNISIVIHCNSISNEILFPILHLHIIIWKRVNRPNPCMMMNMKMAGTGPLFQVRRGPKELLKLHWVMQLYLDSFYFIPLRAEFSVQHRVSNTSNMWSSFNVRFQVHTNAKQWVNS
jgi:hypothetical protein